MPGGLIEQHLESSFARLAIQPQATLALEFSARNLGRCRRRGSIGNLPLRSRVTRRSPGDAAAQTPDLLDIMHAVWLLFEQVLVKMAAEGGRGEGLMTVLALLVLKGGEFGTCLAVTFLADAGPFGSICRSGNGLIHSWLCDTSALRRTKGKSQGPINGVLLLLAGMNRCAFCNRMRDGENIPTLEGYRQNTL